jgi:hypothetical protein
LLLAIHNIKPCFIRKLNIKYNYVKKNYIFNNTSNRKNLQIYFQLLSPSNLKYKKGELAEKK